MRTIILATVLTAFMVTRVSAQVTYTVTDLGRLGGGYDTSALAINSLGHVAGTAMDKSAHYVAFVYAGSLQGLGSLGGGSSKANAINSSDHIVGRSTTAAGDTHAFLYDAAAMNPQMVDLHALLGFGGRFSSATAVDNAGQIVGTATIANGSRHAFLLTGNTAVDLHSKVSLGGPNSFACGITDTGWIIGASDDANGNSLAFLYNLNTSTLTNLGTLGGPGAAPMALNGAGSVVGLADVSADGNTEFAFQTLQPSPMGPANSLGALGGSYSIALGINAAGQVVGEADDASSFAHAFLYSPAAGMRDLESLIPANSGWFFSYATAINDSGSIVGNGVHNGRSSAFLLTLNNSAPTATGVNIGGNPQVGLLLTGNYTYHDADGDAQGASTFRWLRDGTTVVGTANTYTVALADLGHVLTFEVTPVAATGVSPGSPVVSAGVTIVDTAPVVSANTPSFSTPFSNAIAADLISATDVDSPGSSLAASLSWKKASDSTFVTTIPLGGLSLINVANNTVAPGSRSWSLTGNVLVSPDTYIVRITVSDGSLSNSTDVTITVNKLGPLVTWSGSAAISFGTALSATQLNATANVTGTFVYTPPAGTVLSAGNNQALSVTFTPTDAADYTNATAGTTINVNKVTPVINWPTPASITFGSALGSGQLNASASVPGTFVYTPAAGTVLPVGNGQTLSVAFTPADAVDYTAASSTTTIDVTPAPPPPSGINLVVTRTLTRVGDNVVVQLTISNTGGTAANNVTLTSAKVGGVVGTPLPQSLGTIGAAGSVQATVSVPGSVGIAGAASTLTAAGTYTGGTFNTSARITLP